MSPRLDGAVVLCGHAMLCDGIASCMNSFEPCTARAGRSQHIT